MDRLALVSITCFLLFLTACGSGGGAAPILAPALVVDTDPPDSVVLPAGGDFGDEVELVVTASEEATIFVSFNGGDFAPAGASPASIALPEGETTFEYYAVDAAGNTETSVHVEQYLVDLSPPVLELNSGEPTPIPWLAAVDVEWTSDETCDYSVSVVETGERIDAGTLEGGESASLTHEARDLPDEPITIRIEATDWTGHSSAIEYIIERAAPVRIAVEDDPGDVVIAPAGDRAFVARRFENEIDVVDLASGAIVETIDIGIRAWEVTLNADGTLLYFSNTLGPGAMVTVDVESYEVESVDADVGIPGPVAFSPDGTRGYFTDFFGNVRVLDTDPTSATYHSVIDRVFVDLDLLSGELVVSPDGESVLLNWSQFGHSGLELIDFAGGSPELYTVWESTLPGVHNPSQAIALSADGTNAYVSSVLLFCGFCRFDIDAEKIVHASGSTDVPRAIALFDADKNLLTASLNGNYLHLYDADSMEHRSRFLVGPGAQSVAVSPDGSTAVISLADEILILPLR